MYDNVLHHNCVNLFENCLKNLKFEVKNPNNNEDIKIKSEIDFNLFGIGIPKVPKENEKEIEVKIYKRNILIGRIKKFEIMTIYQQGFLIQKNQN